MSNHKSILARAQLPEQTLPLCMRTDLQRAFEAATTRLGEAVKANEDADSFAGDPVDTVAIAREIEEIRAGMEADTIRFRFRALPQFRRPEDPGPTWESLVAQHPPREDDPEDAKYGFNRATLYMVVARATLVDPVFDDEDWANFRAAITWGQWELITDVLWNLNTLRVMPVPFSPLASQLLATSARESRQQPDSDSL